MKLELEEGVDLQRLTEDQLRGAEHCVPQAFLYSWGPR